MCMGNKICIASVQETGTERPFGRPRHTMGDNINIDLQETE